MFSDKHLELINKVLLVLTVNKIELVTIWLLLLHFNIQKESPSIDCRWLHRHLQIRVGVEVKHVVLSGRNPDLDQR